MPDRVLRANIHSNDRFLGLPDHTCRLCYLACISAADDLGNFEASPGNLKRLWRDYGADTDEQVERIRTELEHADLVRWYELSTGRFTRRYGHLPRFRQRIRHFKRTNPRPPADIEDNENNDPPEKTTDERPTSDGRTTGERQTPDSRPPDVRRLARAPNRIESNLVLTTVSLTPDRTHARPPTAKTVLEKPHKRKPNGNGAHPPDGAGQRWTDPTWVSATAKLVELEPRPGERQPDFADRVRQALQQRLKRPVQPP